MKIWRYTKEISRDGASQWRVEKETEFQREEW